MDTLQYLLERQRLLQKANILSSFYDPNDATSTTDEIEKAPAYTTSKKTHKYIGIHMSKNGKPVYEYPEVNKIEGEIIYKKKRREDMEITEDKEGKSIKIYTPKEIEQTTKLLKDTLGIEKVNDRRSDSTSSRYLKFKYNGSRYDIRIADHTYLIPKDQHKIVLNCTYERADKLFVFEASVYNYTPEDIVNAVQSLDNSITLFKSKEHRKDILNFVKANYDSKDGGITLDSNLYPYDVAMELAGKYMEENKIDDNKYNTNFIGLSSIMENMIAKIKSKDY